MDSGKWLLKKRKAVLVPLFWAVPLLVPLQKQFSGLLLTARTYSKRMDFDGVILVMI